MIQKVCKLAGRSILYIPYSHSQYYYSVSSISPFKPPLDEGKHYQQTVNNEHFCSAQWAAWTMKAMLFAYKMIYSAVNQFYVALLKVNLHICRERDERERAERPRAETGREDNFPRVERDRRERRERRERRAGEREEEMRERERMEREERREREREQIAVKDRQRT